MANTLTITITVNDNASVNIGKIVQSLGGLGASATKSAGQVTQATGGITHAFQRMGEIAGGIVIGRIISSITNNIMEMGKAAVGAAADWEYMQLGFTSLLAKENVMGGMGYVDALNEALFSTLVNLPFVYGNKRPFANIAGVFAYDHIR